MGQIISALKAGFTPPGTAAKEGQEATQSGVSNGAAGIFNNYLPTAKSQFNFAGAMEPQRQQLWQHLFNLSNPANWAGMASAYGNQARQNGVNNANYANTIFGQNSGAAKGALWSGINAGTQAQNDMLANLWSPQSQQQNAGNLLSMANTSLTPSANILQQLGSLVFGQPPVQVGQGLGQTLAGLAPSLVAAGVF